MATTHDDAISELIYAIARAEDAAQDAEDREALGRAAKIRAQVRALRAELADLQNGAAR